MLNKTILNAFTLITIFISNVFAFQMNMNTLLISNAVYTQTNTTFDAYGMNYDFLSLPATQLKLEENGVALYNAIVVEEATREMIAAIQPQIEEYQKKYKVRVAYLNCEPSASFGFTEVFANAEPNTLKFTKEGLDLAKKYQLNGENVEFDAPVDGLTHFEPTSTDPSIVVLSKYKNDAIAGAIVKKNDVESIHFFTSPWESRIAFFNCHIWIPWTNYGLIDGYRRLFFSIQVDDFFISNPWNYTDGTEYRSSIKDMENLAKWQKDLVARLPPGSEYKTELGINGFYILMYSNHKADQGNNIEAKKVEQGYVKPLEEEGDHHWPETMDIDWDDAVLRKGDDLYNYFAKNNEAQDNFYWLTHTFSHQNLNYASLHDADMEIALNVQMAGDKYLGMYNRPCFSQHSIICPEISGLHNGHTLQGFEKNGVTYAVGDTSRPDLEGPNPYYPLVTNQTFANHDGFFIIPRQPTCMYWDCSTEQQNLDLYKERSGDNEMTWDKFVAKDIDSQVINFFKMRHDPYMFHEGNLRNEDMKEQTIGDVTGKFGLLQQWVERMTLEIKKYFNWPLVTLKMDDLVQTYLARLEKQQCQPVFTMVIDDASLNISEIKVSATKGQCTVPFLAIRDNTFAQGSYNEIEQRGEEPETAWIKITDKEPKSIKFSKELKWNDDTYSGKTKSRGTATSAAPSTVVKMGLLQTILICSVLLLVIF